MNDQEFHDYWTSEELDKLRQLADPIFDHIAQSVFDPVLSGNVGMTEFQGMMREMARLDFGSDPGNLEDLSPPMHALFEQLQNTEVSATEKTILQRASSFFEKYGPMMLMSLFYRSLLKQYAATHAADILVQTSMLTDFPDRRIKETMQFVLDVMNPEGYEKGKSLYEKPAIYSILKLRLVHAMVRIRIKHPDIILRAVPDTSPGEPINQEDMILAIQSFSIETIEGIKELGVHPPEEEVENFFQAWNIIGKLLGIQYPDGKAPATYAQGSEIQNRIYARQFTVPNPSGARLAASTLEWMGSMIDNIPLLPHDANISLLKRINGAENHELLRENLKINIGSDSKLVPDQAFKEELFHEVIENILADSRGGKERAFRIYDGFATSWNIRGKDDYNVQSTERLFWVTVKSFFETIWNRIVRFFNLK